MDLGIRGRRALVCASSRGLGLGCARALAGAGVDLVMNARGAEALESAAAATVNLHVAADNYGVLEDLFQSISHILVHSLRMAEMPADLVTARKF